MYETLNGITQKKWMKLFGHKDSPATTLHIFRFSLQFSLQLTDTLKVEHLQLADDFIFPGKILVKFWSNNVLVIRGHYFLHKVISLAFFLSS